MENDFMKSHTSLFATGHCCGKEHQFFIYLWFQRPHAPRDGSISMNIQTALRGLSLLKKKKAEHVKLGGKSGGEREVWRVRNRNRFDQNTL